MVGVSRDTTVVRIPLKSAKHHFGASVSRGSRPYNEDAYQAGVIELPAFAKRPPMSLTRKRNGSESSGEGTVAQSASGDPQVFYFGVFDGHGGAECSGFLRERLHEYIENTATDFEMQSSLRQTSGQKKEVAPGRYEGDTDALKRGQEALDSIEITKSTDTRTEGESGDGRPKGARELYHPPYPGDPPLIQGANRETMISMEKRLVQRWKELVGGYFRRFKPAYFSLYGGYQALGEGSESLQASGKDVGSGAAIEEVMTYAFLKADYDFVSAQAAKQDQHDDQIKAERPLNEEEVLGKPHRHAGEIGGPKRFKGGSTCTVAMVSTPSPTPFWNPATSSSMLIAHVGDTRVIICSTATGAGIPLTSDHHPSSPMESNRLRRYAATFVTDSFGEERISGLANTRASVSVLNRRSSASSLERRSTHSSLWCQMAYLGH
jgi:protein phosphatase PTC6